MSQHTALPWLQRLHATKTLVDPMHDSRAKWEGTQDSVYATNNFTVLLPVLQRARRISAADFVHGRRKVDIADHVANGSSVGDFVLFDAREHLPEWLGALASRDWPRTKAALRATTASALEHVRWGESTRRVGIDEVVFESINLARGILGPTVHWDPNWNSFPSRRASTCGACSRRTVRSRARATSSCTGRASCSAPSTPSPSASPPTACTRRRTC